MDAERVALLREVLGHTGWWERALALGGAVRRTPERGGLLLVGTPAEEPWHLAAHLDDESRLTGLEQLSPTLVRWQPPPGAPPHLSVGLDRLERVQRGQTVFVVAPDTAPDPLLERVDDARRTGATILSVDGGDDQLGDLAHERMTVSPGGLLLPPQLVGGPGVATDGAPLEVAQHLVSAAAGEETETGAGWRMRLARLIESISGPAPQR